MTEQKRIYAALRRGASRLLQRNLCRGWAQWRVYAAERAAFMANMKRASGFFRQGKEALMGKAMNTWREAAQAAASYDVPTCCSNRQTRSRSSLSCHTLSHLVELSCWNGAQPQPSSSSRPSSPPAPPPLSPKLTTNHRPCSQCAAHPVLSHRVARRSTSAQAHSRGQRVLTKLGTPHPSRRLA